MNLHPRGLRHTHDMTIPADEGEGRKPGVGPKLERLSLKGDSLRPSAMADVHPSEGGDFQGSRP
jgi:hypothetical protein